MNRKLGRVVTNRRIATLITFLAAIFAWFLDMQTLFIVSVVVLVFGITLYIKDKFFPDHSSHPHHREKSA